MTVRWRSTAGAVLGGLGVFTALAGLLFLRMWLFWAGAGVAAAGLGLVLWALRDVGREIGGNQARFEAMLRSEIPPGREQKRGQDR
jgi:hypothetical protein